jgi:hypothetical protein
MSSSLDDVLTPARRDGTLVLTVPDGWQQGRGAFGGIVFGGLVRAADVAVGDPARAVRTVSAALFAPVLPGPVEAFPTVLKASANVTTVEVRLVQAGALVGHGVVVAGRSRDGTPAWSPAWTPPPDWRDVPPMPVDLPMVPVFTQHLEFRNVGSYPFQGSSEPKASGWCRPRVPARVRDAAWLAAMADAWWSAGATTFDRLRPFATLQFQLDVVGDPRWVGDDEPVWCTLEARTAGDGFLSEDREIWTAGGRLLARNRQLMVVIK